MAELIVQIDRFVDEHQPGVVACSLLDAYGTCHIFVEKIPVVTTENIWKNSQYPLLGTVACRVERAWCADDGRHLVQVNSEFPWHVESAQGETCFVVLASQVRA